MEKANALKDVQRELVKRAEWQGLTQGLLVVGRNNTMVPHTGYAEIQLGVLVLSNQN